MLTGLQLLCALDQSELPLDRRRPRKDYAITSQFGFTKRVLVLFSRFGDGISG